MRVLCTCLPGSGHFLPLVPLGRALVGAGHEVAFATAGEFLPSVEQLGFTAFPAGISLPRQLEEAGARYPEAALPPGRERFERFVPRMLAGVAAPPKATDLVEIVGDWHPDLVVHDETDFGGVVAAARFGLPYADQSVGILRPLSMARLAGQALAPLAERMAVDVGPFGGLFRYLYLDVCPPSLQSAQIAQIDVAHLAHNQATAGAGDGEAPAWLASLPERPTVYVSLGTIFNRDQSVFGAVLLAVRDLAVNVIMTIGADNDPSAFGPQPSHVHIERFVPQAHLLPHCDAVVNQGGTAILDILGHGLPLLLLPRSANQFHNADACVARGVARRLLPAEVTAGAVRAELSTLLGDGAFARAAAEVEDEIGRMPGPEAAVALVERLAGERSPLVATPAG